MSRKEIYIYINQRSEKEERQYDSILPSKYLYLLY